MWRAAFASAVFCHETWEPIDWKRFRRNPAFEVTVSVAPPTAATQKMADLFLSWATRSSKVSQTVKIDYLHIGQVEPYGLSAFPRKAARSAQRYVVDGEIHTVK